MQVVTVCLMLLVAPTTMQAQSSLTDDSTRVQLPKIDPNAAGEEIEPYTSAGEPYNIDDELFADSILNALNQAESEVKLKPEKEKRDWGKWRPSAKNAMWLAIVLPGAGQIYNRKYWKLPIIYGGIVGCTYALSWNNQMYHDYSQAYLDIMDNDPNTASYNSFLHLGTTITDSNKSQYQEIFRKRKDKFRKWRDLSVFCLIGVYALSIIDAYVDASLSEFDISEDLTLHVAPTVITSEQSRNPLQSSGIGIGCSLNF